MKTIIETMPRRSDDAVPVEREDAIDCLKGILVLFMALYHSINYTPHYNLAFVYMAFLPPSFIFLAGFLLTHIYTRKYDLRDRKLHLRLLKRGAKLLALFTVMNLVVQIVLMTPGRHPVEGALAFFSRWQSVYFAGSGRVAVFEILLPIAYFLLLSPLVFFAMWLRRWLVPVLAVGLCALCWLLEQRHHAGENLLLLSAGLLGMACGVIPLATIRRISQRWGIIIPVYLLYRWLSAAYGESYLVQTSDVLVTLLFLYGLLDRFHTPNQFFEGLALLGKYSLVAYIIQIAWLQVFVHLFGRDHGRVVEVLALFAATTAISYFAALVTDFCRSRYRWSDRLYHAAFA